MSIYALRAVWSLHPLALPPPEQGVVDDRTRTYPQDSLKGAADDFVRPANGAEVGHDLVSVVKPRSFGTPTLASGAGCGA